MLVFKICHRAEWSQALRGGAYPGSAKDRADGYLHFSTAEQLAGTLARYYAEAEDLLLIAAEADQFGAAMKFEAARDGTPYPHLYGPLTVSAVRWARPIGRGAKGEFVLPSLDPD